MNLFTAVPRLLLFGTWALCCILFAFTFSLLLLSKKPMAFFANRVWAPLALFIMGVRVKVDGREHLGENVPYVIMANHCSYLDIPVLFKAIPIHIHFIAKKELKRMPFLGWYLVLSDTILIDRKNTALAKESLAEAARLVNKGRHVVIFPEGTASKTGKIAPFKKGGFFLAQDAEAFILPVHIKGSYEVWPSANKLKIRPGTITVTIGAPVSPEIYNRMDMDDRVRHVQSLIETL